MYGLFPLMMDIDELSVNGTLCIDVMYLSGKVRFADILRNTIFNLRLSVIDRGSQITRVYKDGSIL